MYLEHNDGSWGNPSTNTSTGAGDHYRHNTDLIKDFPAYRVRRRNLEPFHHRCVSNGERAIWLVSPSGLFHGANPQHGQSHELLQPTNLGVQVHNGIARGIFSQMHYAPGDPYLTELVRLMYLNPKRRKPILGGIRMWTPAVQFNQRQLNHMHTRGDDELSPYQSMLASHLERDLIVQRPGSTVIVLLPDEAMEQMFSCEYGTPTDRPVHFVALTFSPDDALTCTGVYI